MLFAPYYTTALSETRNSWTDIGTEKPSDLMQAKYYFYFHNNIFWLFFFTYMLQSFKTFYKT